MSFNVTIPQKAVYPIDLIFRYGLLKLVFKEKKISDNQLLRLDNNGSTIQLKGFKEEGKIRTGKLSFNSDFELIFKSKVDLFSLNIL